MMSVKAFEIASYGVRLKIQSLECCEKNLYVGTPDSYLVHYLLEERTTTSDGSSQTKLHCVRQREKCLGTKKPVLTIKAASAINRLLVLSDGTIFLLNAFDLEIVSGGTRIKGVTNFCVNQDPLSNNPFDFEICVARKRGLQIYNVTEDKALHIKDVSLSETPNAMAMDGKYVCVALASKYALVDCEVSSVQEILPYDITITNPIIVRISKGEFLLNGPNALGVFVTTACISERPPIIWSSKDLNSIAFVHPYVVALNAQSLLVYSVLDYKQKQRIAFAGGFWLDNYDGRLLATTASGDVYGLLAVPWQRQVKDLLGDNKVDEALELANHSHRPNHSKEQFKEIYRKFQQEAGFIEFSSFRFDRARELFVEGQLDPRELIRLYPGLMPTTTNFVRSASPMHAIANIAQMCRNDVAKVEECFQFLIGYLEDIREMIDNLRSRQDVDMVLLKLYAKLNPSALTSLIVSSDLSAHMADCSEWLERHGRLHALALLHSRHGHPEKALDIWVRLLDSKEEEEDSQHRDYYFPGLPFVVEFLAKLDDANLLWKCADTVLSKDQELGVKIFTDRPRNGDNGFSSGVKADAVTDFLQQYPKALVKYLEHLVFTSNNSKENFHTHLAVLYLENVLRLKRDQNVDQSPLCTARQKLQHLLRTSSSYRFQFLLAKLQNTELHLETALIYGKLEEHDKALRLLVHKSNDPNAATDYCQHYARDQDISYRQKLFHTLLGVYLDSTLTFEKQDDLFQPAISLINSELAEFEASAVLRLLPNHWSACIVDQFLLRAMRQSMDKRRTKQMEHALAKAENVRTRFARYCLQRDAVCVTEDSTCPHCGGSFSEPEFVRFLNGEPLHPHCARQMDIQLDQRNQQSSLEQHHHQHSSRTELEKPPAPVR